MRYEILKNGNLRIFCAPDEQLELKMRREQEEVWGALNDECEVLEHLIANSELDWVPEGVTGDLTCAPMLGITDCGPQEGYEFHELPVHRFGHMQVGAWGNPPVPRYSAIIARWAYMHYQVSFFADDLADHGECIWEGGFADPSMQPEPWARPKEESK